MMILALYFISLFTDRRSVVHLDIVRYTVAWRLHAEFLVQRHA